MMTKMITATVTAVSTSSPPQGATQDSDAAPAAEADPPSVSHSSSRLRASAASWLMASSAIRPLAVRVPPVGRVHGDVGDPAPARVQRVRQSGDLPEEITGAGPPGTVQETWTRAGRGQGQPGRRRRQAFFEDRRFDGRGHDTDLSPSLLLEAGVVARREQHRRGGRCAKYSRCFHSTPLRGPGRAREQAFHRDTTSPAPPASAAGAAAHDLR